MGDDTRLLTDADVSAIVSELKRQLAEDFQLEVGRGVIAWLKRGLWLPLPAGSARIHGRRRFGIHDLRDHGPNR